MLAALFAVGILVRVVLLPTEGLRDDMDQFVGWVHHIATQGLPTLYQGTDAGPVTFGPVMAYVWATLGVLHPAFQTITDAADPLTRAWMKAPASLADIGLALLVVFALRDRPRWAALGALAVLLLPAIPYVSAWWGQYESIFVLSGLAAAMAAARGHNGVAAALVAVSLATKPQAIPFLVPFAAWFWATGAARDGWRGGVLELAKTGAIGLATTVVLWAPFLTSGGPRDYLANLGYYQDVIFPYISIRAWNVWWLLQIAAGPDGFIHDNAAFLGPVRAAAHRIPGDGPAVGGDRHPDHPRPAPAGLLPGPGGVGHDVLHVHDPDARALRLRRGDPARAAPAGRAYPLAVDRPRGRLHAQPRRGHPAIARDRRAGARSAGCSGSSAASR